MSRVIYLDILISVNLFVNYFMLLAVSKFIYIKVNRFKIIFGALVGSIFSIIILLPEINILVSNIIKFLVSFLMVICSFGIKDKVKLIKSWLYLYLVITTFFGMIFIVTYILGCNNIIFKNSFVYFNISPIVLIISTVISYILLEILNKFIGKHINKSDFYRISIEMSKKYISFDAKLDTGLTLKEPFSNLPVIIASENIVKNIFPKNFSFEDSELLKNLGYNVRIVPFSTITENSFLVAFKPEKIILHTLDGLVSKDGYVAVCSDEKLSGQAALIGFDIIN